MIGKCSHISEQNKVDFTYFNVDGTIAGYYCDECAIQRGFCIFCGKFEVVCNCKFEPDSGNTQLATESE